MGCFSLVYKADSTNFLCLYRDTMLISICLFCFLCSNNNRSSRKITGKKFQPLMSQDVTERSDVADSSYSCSPSKQGPLRLKLSSKDFFIKFAQVAL